MSAEAADGLDDIRAFVIHRGPKCTVGVAFRHMDAALADKVKRAMAVAETGTDRAITWKAIADFLASLDYSFSAQTLSRHHHGECRCG